MKSDPYFTISVSWVLCCGWVLGFGDTLSLPNLASAAGVADEVDSRETFPGWGRVEDPDGDCTFDHAEGKFTIKVPGAYHDLWPVQGKVNAPRVLQEVAGDFSIEVLVEEVSEAVADTVLPGLASTASFHAGSLIVWQDANNFVRFDRTNMNKGGRATTACYLHVFQDGARIAELAPFVPDRPTHLRLTHGETASLRRTVRMASGLGPTWQRRGSSWTTN